MASAEEPPTLRSIPPSAGGFTSLRRSYSCYNCNYSFHIIPTADPSSTASSFRCPRCHHRHLLPHYTLPTEPLPVSLFLSTPTNSPPDISSFEYQTSESESESDESDESEDSDYDYDEDYDSDNSALSFTDPISHSPALQSFVDSLPVKKFPPNSTPPALSCSICMEVFDVNSEGTINELPCQHLFHGDCIVEWLKLGSTCPLCRHQLPSESSPEEDINPGQTNELGVEYNDFVVLESTPVETTLSRASGGGSLDSNGGVSGSDRRVSSANGGELRAWEIDAMHDEDGDTLMTDV